MLSEIAIGVWCYSCFLTLREWQVIIYMIIVLTASIYGLINIFYFDQLNLLLYILNLMFYFIGLYFVLIAYKQFRLSGGIHGGKSRE